MHPPNPTSATMGQCAQVGPSGRTRVHFGHIRIHLAILEYTFGLCTLLAPAHYLQHFTHPDPPPAHYLQHFTPPDLAAVHYLQHFTPADLAPAH